MCSLNPVLLVSTPIKYERAPCLLRHSSTKASLRQDLAGLKQIYIPKIPSVSPWKIHPTYEHIRPEYEEWKLSLVEPETEDQRRHLLGQNLVMFACMLFPEALEKRIGLLVQFVAWFTLFDTHVDDMEDLGANSESTNFIINKYLNIMTGSSLEEVDRNLPPKHKRLISAFASARAGILQDMTPSQASRFEDDVCAYLKSQTSQNKLREEGALLSVSELLFQRRVVTCFMTMFHMVEFSMGVDLGSGFFDDPEVMEFSEISTNNMLICNDMLSFRVEYLGNDFHNIMCTIAMVDKVSLQTATQSTIRLLEDNSKRFDELQKSISTKYSKVSQVKTFLDGVGLLVAGNLEWSWRTGRYHGPDWVAPLQRQGFMSLEPAIRRAMFIPA